MHLEFGTNSLPVSLLCEDGGEKPEELNLYAEHLYREVEGFVVKFLKDRRAKSTQFLSGGDNKTKITKAMGMSSKDLSVIKSQIMASESKVKQSREDVLEKEQKDITGDLIDALKGLKINYDNIIKTEPEVEPPKTTVIEKPIKAADNYEYLHSFISNIIGKKFNSNRLFNSQTDNPNSFKAVLAGQTDILFRV